MNAAVANFYWKQLAGAARVLDLGCGSGGLGRFAPASALVFGVELSPQLAGVARQHEKVTLCDLDQAGALPFADASFDAVVAKDILEHLQRPWLIARDMHRVLRPGGLVLGSVICEKPARIAADYTHVRGFTFDSAQALLEDAGFTVLKAWRMGPLPLASRLNAIAAVPAFLRVPIVRQIYTSSYEMLAQRRDASPTR